MATMTRPTSDITRAAERYLEQYGDPLVMNTYLKVTILVLCAVCLALAALAYKSQQALANMHPMIVRINDVGRAKPSTIATSNTARRKPRTSIISPAGRNCTSRAIASRLNATRQRALLPEQRRSAGRDRAGTQGQHHPDYVRDSTLPYVDVEVKNVVLDDLRQSPYSARVEFEKVYTNTADHTELKRERWTASVTYVFRDNVKNNELAVNPLGLTIVRFRADQAFE
jgi:type IV secretory pathway TrbF-like protein